MGVSSIHEFGSATARPLDLPFQRARRCLRTDLVRPWHVLGALTDILIQLFASMFLDGSIVSTLRGDGDDVPGRSLMLLGGPLLVAWLVSRIVRTAYTVNTRQVVLTVDALSIPHFVVDLAWVSLGVAWLHGSLTTPDQAQPPDPAFYYGGPTVLLGLAAGLLALPAWTRMSTWSTEP
jgi:hypothetical protein